MDLASFMNAAFLPMRSNFLSDLCYSSITEIEIKIKCRKTTVVQLFRYPTIFVLKSEFTLCTMANIVLTFMCIRIHKIGPSSEMVHWIVSAKLAATELWLRWKTIYNRETLIYVTKFIRQRNFNTISVNDIKIVLLLWVYNS